MHIGPKKRVYCLVIEARGSVDYQVKSFTTSFQDFVTFPRKSEAGKLYCGHAIAGRTFGAAALETEYYGQLYAQRRQKELSNIPVAPFKSAACLVKILARACISDGGVDRKDGLRFSTLCVYQFKTNKTYRVCGRDSRRRTRHCAPRTCSSPNRGQT